MPSLTEEKLNNALLNGATYESIASIAANKRPEFKKLLDEGVPPKDALYQFYSLGEEGKEPSLEFVEPKVETRIPQEGDPDYILGEYSPLPQEPPAVKTHEQSLSEIKRIDNQMKKARFWGGMQGLSNLVLGSYDQVGEKAPGVTKYIAPDLPAPLKALKSVIELNSDAYTNPERAVQTMTDVVDTVTKVANVATEEEGVPRIVLGMAAQIGMDESSKVAATKAGARRGARGALAGYLAGALGGGAVSSYVAQNLEGKEDLSWGRIIRDSFLNVIPGAKITKGPKVLRVASEKMAARPVTSTAAVGAAAGFGGSAVEQMIDKGEVEVSQMATEGALSTLLGTGLGLSNKAVNGFLKKLGRKTPEQLDKMVASGDPIAVNYFDAVTQSLDSKKIADPDNSTQYLGSLIKFSKERPGQKLRGKFASVVPSLTAGPEATYQMQKAQQRVAAKQERGRTLDARVQRLINKSDNPEATSQIAKDYLAGKIQKLPKELSKLKGELSDARKEIKEFQDELLSNHYTGKKLLPKAHVEMLEASKARGDYLTTSYRAFDDADYEPSQEDYQRVIKYLTTTPRRGEPTKTITKQVRDGVTMKVKVNAEPKELPPMTVAEAEEYVSGLRSRFKSSEDGYAFMQSKDANILKKKGDVAEPIRRWLGEYAEPGKQISDTISRMAKKVGYDTGDAAVLKALLDSDMAKVAGGASGQEASPKNWERLVLRHGNAMVDDKVVLVPPELNKAVKSIYGMDLDGKSNHWFYKMIETGTSFSKAQKVVMNPASYAPNFWSGAAYIGAMGMNPFRGAARGALAAVAQFDFMAKRLPSAAMKMVDNYKTKGVMPKALMFEDLQVGLKGGKVRRFISKWFGFDFAGKAFSALDTVSRIIVYENNAHLYRKAAGVKLGSDAANILDDLAARDTNKVFPNYEMLSKGLRKLSQIGLVQQFVSFNAELTRNAVNQAKIAKEMVNGKLADELEARAGVTINRGIMRADGIKRMIGLATVVAGAEGGRRMWNRRTTTEEEEQRIMNTVLPEYMQGNPVALNVDWETGDVQYNNTSYMNPLAILGNAIWGYADADDADGAARHTWDLIKANLLGEGSFMARTMGQMAFNYDVRTGRKISNEFDDFRKAVDLMQFGGQDAFEPGYIREKRRFDKHGANQFAARMAGVRIENTNILDGVSFKLTDVKKSMNNTLRDIASLRYTLEDGRISEEDMNSQYEAFNGTYRRAQEKLITHVDDLQKLRRSDEEIFAVLQASGLGAKRSLYAYDGIVLDAPKHKDLRLSERYDVEMDKTNGNFEQALANYAAQASPFELKRFGDEHKKRITYQALNIKTKDDMVRALDAGNGDRARYIWRKMQESANPNAVLEVFLSKKLVSEEVLYQISQLKNTQK